MKAVKFLLIVFYLTTSLAENNNPTIRIIFRRNEQAAQILNSSQYTNAQVEFNHIKRGANFKGNENLSPLENCVKSYFQKSDCTCFTWLLQNDSLSAVLIYKYPNLDKFCRKSKKGKTDRGLKNNFEGCGNKDTFLRTVIRNLVIANCSELWKNRTRQYETTVTEGPITSSIGKRSVETSVDRPPMLSDAFPNNSDKSNSEINDKESGSSNFTDMLARKSELQFLDVPRGDDMRIQDLQLDKEYLLFEAFSGLMGYLQPSGFPSELLRDALQNHPPLELLVFQLLKLEIVGVGWIFLWAILALCLPFATAAHFCCPSGSIQRLNEYSSNASLDLGDKWTSRSLGCLLHVLLLLLLCPILLILAANEQISKSITKLPTATDIMYEDINTFIRNTHMQVSFVTTSSTDIAIESIRKDLEDVENLLGKPFQQELITQTGVDIALENLEELKTCTAKVVCLVAEVLEECSSARTIGNSLQEQLQGIARQLDVARQQCSTKDRGLCYTLQYSGFEVNFSAVDNLPADYKIQHLERIGREKNFNTSIEIARMSFQEIPSRVTKETAQRISDIKTTLSRKRTEVYKSTHNLDELSRNVTKSVTSGLHNVLGFIQILVEWDMWRWLVILGVASVLSLIWGLLLCGAPCGCGLTSKTVHFLLSGVSLSCMICMFVWALATTAFLLGGHGQSILCQPLYDQPHYRSLGELVDSEGILYDRGGLFQTFIKENGSLKIRSVLKDCRNDQPAYSAFHLYNQLDVNAVVNYNSWRDLKLLFTNFSVVENNLEILSPSLQLNLQILSTISNVNLTPYRISFSAPITRRDIRSFGEQLNTVARQLSDPLSSRKFDKLAFSVKKLVQGDLHKLEELRNKILYKITTLEVLMIPLNKQANQSLSHLKTIQFFLDNQGWGIAEKTGRQFTSRIENKLQDLYDYINLKVTKEIGRCRPLWEVFNAARFYVCKLMIDPVNGISFSCFFLILLFLGIAPVVIKLVEYYRETNEDVLTSISHRRARNGIVIDDEGTWVTPTSEIPEVPLQSLTHVEPRTWVTPSPRQPSEPLIPPPPSKLTALASRITSARAPQIPSVSRARSLRRQRHESLHLMEPTSWSSETIAPRSWM